MYTHSYTVTLLSCIPTYNNGGMAQHTVFDRVGLVQLHDCSLQAATAKQTALCKRPSTSSNLHRGRMGRFRP